MGSATTEGKERSRHHNRRRVLTNEKELKKASSETAQGCQMAKFDPFYSLDCARVQAVGAQSKERKGSNFAAQRSGAIGHQARRVKTIQSKNLAIAIWQP